MLSDTITKSAPVYFGPGNRLFGWLHSNPTGARRTPVIICPPLGFEFVRAYRAVRTLARKLAGTGHITLRFDYAGTGDSHEYDQDSDAVTSWIDSICSAIDYVMSLTGSESVVLVGIRLGGTLASKVAQLREIHSLVLWEPAESGKTYCREMQMIEAGTKSTRDVQKYPGIDAAGFYLTTKTIDGVKELILGQSPFIGRPRILLLERDDIALNERRASQLEMSGSELKRQSISDYKAMMLAPQEARVPEQSIELIAGWLSETCSPNAASDEERGGIDFTNCSETVLPCRGTVETAIQFGPENRLFGILTQSREGTSPSGPTVILLTGGAVPHFSTNRMYVPLARRLASRGRTVLRMSFSGIGDSDPSPGGPSSVAYTATSNEDLQSALDMLTEKTGVKRFTLFGFCSGAYAAMKFARTSDRVERLILANQLVYFLSDEDLVRLANGELRSASSLDFPRSKTAASRTLRKLLRNLGRSGALIGELFQRDLVGGSLGAELRALSARGIQLSFIQSQDDPAQDALLLPARRTIAKMLRSSAARLVTIPASDHNFSSVQSQERLFLCIDEILGERRQR